MPTSSSGTFKALVEQGGSVSERLSLTGLVSQVHKVGASLTLRELGGTNGFANSVCCHPGTVTIIRYQQGEKARSFRKALLAKSENPSISIRYGAKPLHPSEVFLVGTSRYVWKEPTVADVLRVAGASAQDISSILEAIEIDEKASPTSITDAEMRRLTICCSFFSPAPVILFDKPFDPFDEYWVNVIGELMLSAAKRTKKIFVVTELDRLPKSWTASTRVIRASFDDQEDMFDQKSKNDQLLKHARAMLRSNREDESSNDYFITRPQTIHDKPSRPRVFESLHTESIQNPKIEPVKVEGAVEEATESVSKERESIVAKFKRILRICK